MSLHGCREPGEDEQRALLVARMEQSGAPQAEIDRARRVFERDNRAAWLTRLGLLVVVLSLLGFCTFDALA